MTDRSVSTATEVKPASPASVPARSTGGGGGGGDAALGLHQKGYLLEKTLGSGAYAKVKQAHSVSMNKKVAIKIIDKKKAPRDVLTKFLPREIEALQLMKDHDNAVTLYDVIHTTDRVFIVMELVENGDLLDYINSKRKLSERTSRGFFRDLVSVVIATHKHDIVHRDIKCENLLLDVNYRLKISDFGFARSLKEKSLLETYCGSFAYAAPEIICGEPYNGKKSDSWSMGVVLYAMVCGKLPFREGDYKTLVSQIVAGVSFSSDISENCKDLIRKILVVSPTERLSPSEILNHAWMKQDPERC